MGNSEYGLEVGAAEPEDFFPERFVLPEAQQSETYSIACQCLSIHMN